MIFEKQEYQQECIKNCVEILQNFDFKRQDRENLKDCLQKFQKDKNIAVKNLSGDLNIDILMETGTGKTFTYLNLIYELNRVYRQNKFIIFLPRKAILEGVRQNIELTKDYFANQFGGKRIKSYFYSDTKSLGNIISHYINNKDELSVLVLTSGAMNKGDNNKKSVNVLHRNDERLFDSGSIFDSIASLKPISIIDEPHLLKGDAFSKNFAKLNSLYFRFGATFPNEKDFELSNVGFVLDSISAFRRYLVKQVAVSTLFENSQIPKLKEISQKNKTAKFNYFLDNVECERSVKFGDDLGEALRYSDFIGVEIVNANKDEIFLSNGLKIPLAKDNYILNESQISHLISKAIDLHFEKEEKLFKQGIKALSLFFIPNIKDFRGDDEKDGFIRAEFERLYKIKRAEILKQNLDKNYRAFLNKDFDESGNLRVCEGYFSGDKGSAENIEADAVRLILNEKEKLLSLDTPLRFIFSVWALQEGWDNPNIFTLTKLASSASQASKKQQIGRGLRLCVNRNGKRITHNFCGNDDEKFYELNRLDVLVHNSELNFIEGLQNEINKASFEATDFIDRVTLKNRAGLNEGELDSLFGKLQKLNCVKFDEEKDGYKIIAPIYESLQNDTEIKERLGEKFNAVLNIFKPNENKNQQIKDANKEPQKIKIRKNLAKEFKELWQSLNSNVKMSYKNIDENKIINAIKDQFNALNIKKEGAKFETKIYNAKTDRIEFKQSEVLENKALVIKDMYLNLIEFAKNEHLPLKFILNIYNACKDKIIINPQYALNKLKECIKEQIHANVVNCVSYDFNDTFISNGDLLFDEKGEPKEWIEKHNLGSNVDENEPKEPYLYKSAVYDSQIEKGVIENDEKEIVINKHKITIKVFAKLPKFSIPTPYKTYQPDFAYLMESDEGKRLFLICETKGYDKIDEISTEERLKIDYAKHFFESLNSYLSKNPNVEVYFRTRINKENLNEILQDILKTGKIC